MLNLKTLTVAVVLGVLAPDEPVSILYKPQVLAQASAEQKTRAERLFQQGIQQFGTSQYQAALQSWQEALRIYREIGNHKGEASSLNNLGGAYYHLGQYQEAIKFYQQSLALARELGDHQGEARFLGNLGIAYENLGRYQEAIKFYQQSLVLTRELGDRQGEASSLGNLGIAYENLGQYQEAIKFHQQSLVLARELGDRQEAASSLGNLGSAYYRLGRYQEAIKFHQQSLALARELGVRQVEASSLNNLGNAYWSWGQYQKAIKFHQQSLALAQELGVRQVEAISLNNLGNDYWSLGQYQKAIEFHQQSLDIFKDIGNRNGVGNSMGNLGNAYDYLGQYQKAIEFHQQSLTIAREIGARQQEGASLGNLGNTYWSLGQYQKVIDYHQHSLAIKRELGDRQGEAISLNSLGNAYSGLGQYQKAIDYHQQSLNIFKEIGDRQGEGASLGNLGNTYRSWGQYQTVIEYQQQSLAIKRKIGDRNGEAISLNSLGIAYGSLGQYQKAIEYQQQSLAITRKIGDPQGEADALFILGSAYFGLNQLFEAEETLLSGINIFESIRLNSGEDQNKISIFEIQVPPYQALQKVRVALNKTNEALEIAERSRAKGLVDLLNARLSDNPEDLKVNPLTIQQIQQIAKNKQATLVLYSLVDEEIFTWVIKPTGEVEFQRQDYKSNLNELVEVARDSIGVRDRGVIKLIQTPESDQTKQREKLQKLHQLLIEPIAKFLPENPDEPVIFMPQGALFLVPFPALQDAEGNYLVDKHTILSAPSIQTLQLTGKQRQKVSGKGVLIVGNPTMPSVPKEIGEEPVQLTPLDGAETEAKEIAKFFNTNAMIGSQATKSAVLEKISNARVVHLATHGLLDDFGLGVPGTIALAPDPNFTPEIGEFNGLLTAGEIFDLDLSAELVVLSACNTGRGQIRGEGVIGLSRSLIQAGVPSVLVSLWQVPDAPTAELMVEFYRNLEEKNFDKAQALRQAMLTIKDKHPNPRNWAAFTLIGEAD